MHSLQPAKLVDPNLTLSSLLYFTHHPNPNQLDNLINEWVNFRLGPYLLPHKQTPLECNPFQPSTVAPNIMEKRSIDQVGQWCMSLIYLGQTVMPGSSL